MSFWEKNREILAQHYGALVELLAAASNAEMSADDLTPEHIKIEAAATGEPSLSVKGIYVHSPRDPAREAFRLAESVNTSANSPIVILGFGLGYAAQAAAKTAADHGGSGARPVIIVEKYKSLLRLAFEQRDLTDLLLCKNIIFIAGGKAGEGITNALEIAGKLNNDYSEPAIIRNRALIDIDKEWYSAAEETIRTWITRQKVNTATLNRFGKRWIRNLSRNMSAIRDCPGILRLTGLADGIPVFLAAAGPSLDKIAPLLRDIHRRCFIVAVDTSLRFFSANNIQPDFVLTVDPQFWNNRHLDRCVCEKSILIAESAVFPPALRLPFKHIFLCGSFFPLGDFIEKQVDPKGRLEAGGSVATSAWDFARSLALSPVGGEIWIAGLDLSFPDLKTHFRGAIFEERSNAASNRFAPAETWVVSTLRDGFPFKAASAAGGQVLTDRRLSLYASWFENQFRRYSNVHNYSIFQNGIAINGLKSANADALLALPDCRDEINRRLDLVLSSVNADFYHPDEVCKRAERYKKAVSGLIHALENIKAAAENGAKTARQASYSSTTSEQQSKVLKKLDDIMRRITASDVKEVAGFLFPPVEEEKSESDAFRSYLKTSYKFFSSLAESVGVNLESINVYQK